MEAQGRARTGHVAARTPRQSRGRDGEKDERRMGKTGDKGEEEQRARCLRQFSDRDWLHPTLPTERGQTVPLLPYYILHNSNSERSELLRCSSWGWMKEKRRKEAVRFMGGKGEEGSPWVDES